MIELTFLKELMLMKQINQKSVVFATIGNLLDKCFKFQTYVCNGCLAVFITYLNHSYFAILNISSIDLLEKFNEIWDKVSSNTIIVK